MGRNEFFRSAAGPAVTSSRFGSLRDVFEPPAFTMVLERMAASPGIPRREARDEAHKHDRELDSAYSVCSDIIRTHSKSFHLSARLLPPHKRRGVFALYAFCRTSDDLVDKADASANQAAARDEARSALDRWSSILLGAAERSGHPVAHAWADTQARYRIPSSLAEELLAGVRMDLTMDRYETWDDLWLYCFRVASTVGLMSMYITGAESMQAVPYAVQLGIALQLTNILRDVGEDARVGRVYLPAEDMHRFGYSREKALAGILDDSFLELMRFQVERARTLYMASMPGICHLPPDSRVAVMAAARLYEGILDKIEASCFDVFTRRAHLSAAEKLRAIPGIWWNAKRAHIGRTKNTGPAATSEKDALYPESQELEIK